MESDTFHDYQFECGAKDIVVARISLKNATVAEGSEVRRIGRGGDERGVGIAVDENNRLYIVGTTTSLLAQTCTNGYPSQCGGASDLVVLMMDAMRLERLSVLQYGSHGADFARGVLSGLISGQIFVYGYMDGDASSSCASFTYNDEEIHGNERRKCGTAYNSILSKIEVDVTRPVHSMMEVKWFTRWGGSSTQDTPASSVLRSDTARLYVIGTTRRLENDNVSINEFHNDTTTELDSRENQITWQSQGLIGPCVAGWHNHTCLGLENVYVAEFDRISGDLMYAVQLGTSENSVASDAFEAMGGIVIGATTTTTTSVNDSDMNLMFLESLRCACGQEPVYADMPLYGSGEFPNSVKSANGVRTIPHLCQFCEEGYYSSDGFECVKCPQGATCRHEMHILDQGMRVVGSAIPIARVGYHRRSESSSLVSSALRPDFLHIFKNQLGDFDACRSDRFDVSYGFNQCLAAHDGSITCLAGYLRGSDDESDDSASTRNNNTEGGSCARGYLMHSNTCSECDRVNGWTRLQGRQMCVKCFTKIQIAIAAVSGSLLLVLLVLTLRCVKMDAPPKGSSMNRHALRNMLAIQSRNQADMKNRKDKTEKEDGKKISAAQMALLGETSETGSDMYTQFDDDSRGESKVQFDMKKSLDALKKRFDRHSDKDIDDDDDDEDCLRLDHAGFKAFVLELSPMLYVYCSFFSFDVPR